MPNYTKFKGVSHIGEHTLSDQLKANIKTWLDWCLLEIGGFSNVAIGDEGSTDIDLSKLNFIADPRESTDGKIWEAFRHDLVWESGLEYAYQPVQPTGVKVDGVVTPFSSTIKLNYPLGQVIFDTPIDPDSTVQMAFSYRYYTTYIADHLPTFKKIASTSFVYDEDGISKNVLSENRIQLPAIIIEVIAENNQYGIQLGGGQWVRPNIYFHIIADNKSDRDKICNILDFQKDKTFFLFDYNKLFADDELPLDENGSLNAGAKMYPTIIADDDYRWKRAYILNCRSQEIDREGYLYRAVTKMTLEIDFQDI